MIKGKYKTRGGFEAIVAQVKSTPQRFWILGAIRIPDTNVWGLHVWAIDGTSDSKTNDFDLINE